MTLSRKFTAALLLPIVWVQAVGAATLVDWKFGEDPPDAPITSVTSNAITLDASEKNAPTASAAVPPGTALKGSALFDKAEKNFLTSGAFVEALNFKENQPFTIEGWVFLSSLPTDKDQAHIFCNRSGLNNENIGLAVLATPSEDQTDKADLRFFFDGGASNNQNFIKAVGVLEANVWYHFQAVREADGTLRLFVNGTEAEGSGRIKIPVALNSDGPVTLGRSMLSGESAVFFDGMIAEVKISDEAILGK